jgi:hypothetical protein
MCALACRLRLFKQSEVQAEKSPFRFGEIDSQVPRVGPCNFAQGRLRGTRMGPVCFVKLDFGINTWVTGIKSLAVARGFWTSHAA